MTATEPIEMHVAWVYPGHVATAIGRAEVSAPCSGPRQAAWELAHRLFGHPAFTLTRRSTCVYVATERASRG